MQTQDNNQFGTGAIPDSYDFRDHEYMAGASDPFDWNAGYDVEKEVGIKIEFQNQGSSDSCVGHAWSIYIAVLNAVETGKYDMVSAKAIFSQIALNYGAQIRDGGLLTVNWGSLFEKLVSSYNSIGTPLSAQEYRDKSWKTKEMDDIAKMLQAKRATIVPLRSANADDRMELMARTMRDNHGLVSGLLGENNGTWRTNEPKPGKKVWGHALYFGKAGVDSKGKFIATPNSWGKMPTGELYPDGWQKLRRDWFEATQASPTSPIDGLMFNPWTLTDKPNKTINDTTMKTNVLILKDENGNTVGAFLPFNDERGMISVAKNFGIEVPTKEDGVDWEAMKIDGTFKLNN